MSEITSPPVRYTGSKWRIAPWVISHFPKHVCYVEPFCGGAAVLFRKPPSQIEVLNDLNGEIVNFFSILRTRTEDLLRAVDLTPFSRYELEQAIIESDDPLERARRFYIRCRQALTAGESDRALTWRFQRNMKRKSVTCVQEWANLGHLRPAAARLKMAHIESDQALNIISRYDSEETLFYVDPPYVHSTRTNSKDYPFEMSDSDHIALADTLKRIQGMALISGYDCKLYREVYSDWHLVTKKAVTLEAHYATECLWISPSAQANHAQKRLF